MKWSGVLLLALMLSGCLLERVGQIDRTLKPYGAHWIKDGMTRESRRSDLAACGSISHEDADFPLDRIAAARLPSDPNDVKALLRLRDQLGACMQARGYRPIGDLKFLGGCDARCLYP